MANCNRQQLNITCGTDVVLHDRLIFEGETFDPNLSVGIAANLVSSLGKRTALDVQVVDDELLISVPWIDGTLPGCYGLEVTGSCNSKKWATYADSLIKYTKATRIGMSEVTIESDTYDITQEVGYCYSNSPVTFAEVTVDDGYGTPSVDVEYEQRELSMAFHNLKGNGITDIDVDEQEGDEAVNTVTIKTDADQEGTEFKVRNGSRGNGIASSSEQLSDQDGGTNTFTITDDDGTVHEFHSKNGTKGSQGDSAVYNPDAPDAPDFVMANTTGDSTTKAMTQKAVTDEFDKRGSLKWGVAMPSTTNRFISGGVWKTGGTPNNCYILPIKGGTRFEVSPRGGLNSFHVEFLVSNNSATSGDVPDFAGDALGWKSEMIQLTAPSNANYLYVRHNNSSTNNTPFIYIISDMREELWKEVDTNSDEYYEGYYYSFTIGSAPSRGASEPHKSYPNFFSVRKGCAYRISIVCGDELAGQGSRACGVVDGGGITRQIITTYWANGKTEVQSFIANCDGNFIFCADLNYISVKVEELSYLGAAESIERIEEQIDDEQMFAEDIKASLVKNAIFAPNYETLTPLAADTYNCYVRTSYPNDIFQANEAYRNRLTYFPRHIVCGGTLTVTSTGLNVITLYELPMRDLSLSPMACNYPMSEVIKTTSFPAGIVGTYEVELDSKTRRIAFVMGATQGQATSPSDITNNLTSVTLPLASYDDFTFTSEESYSDEKTLVKQTKHGNSEVQSLGLIHYSDLHGDDAAVGHLLKAIKRHSTCIDDVISTGDVVYWYADSTAAYPQGSEWWIGCGLPEKSLFVLGNHDDATTSATEYDVVDGGAAWDGKGQQWAFDTYFANYKDELGITLPTGYDDNTSPNYKACFWHKDYDEQKIRLIGLDCIHRFDGVVDPVTGAITSAGYHHLTNEQELWLIDRLNETLEGSGDDAEGYSVVFANHYPLDDFSENGQDGGRVIDHKTGDVVNWHWYPSQSIEADRRFNNRNRVATSSSFTKGTVNNFGNIINAWVANGGKFVVWLCGHYHGDFFYYPESYPELLNIAINQTGFLRGGSVSDKSGNGYDRMSANFISIDTERGLIKIVRLGQKYNIMMIPLNVICYDYVNRKVISEW